MPKHMKDDIPDKNSTNESVGSQQCILNHSDTRIAKQESRKEALDKVKTGLDKAQTTGLVLRSWVVV